ncbi:SPRY domain [Trinorchestia longiramus]|nr:SPRY domain [Trinorchestia longiramus]
MTTCVSYNGRGEQVEDIGLAVAKHALSPSSHYFQLQILDPGKHAYITIGITKKHYPRRCHPGWRTGSVAYHADDGRVFTGGRCAKGAPLGPPCRAGDVMGCGILFPRDYSYSNAHRGSCDESSADESGEDDEAESSLLCSDEDDDDLEDERDDDEDYEEFPSSPGDLLDDIVRDESDVEAASQSMLHKLLSLERLGDDERSTPVAPSPQAAGERRRRRRHHSGNVVAEQSFSRKKISGFIDRNSLLIRDLGPARKSKGRKEGEPVVQVFFTRNGCLLGRVEAVVPKGGFFPTISLGGQKETVRVDLRPLSG